jgi:hypothetical protein
MASEGIEYVYMDTRNFEQECKVLAATRIRIGARPRHLRETATEARRDCHLPRGSVAGDATRISPLLEFSQPEMDVDSEIEIVGPAIDTHWNTRIQTIRDPDGREIMLQHTLDS